MVAGAHQDGHGLPTKHLLKPPVILAQTDTAHITAHSIADCGDWPVPESSNDIIWKPLHASVDTIAGRTMCLFFVHVHCFHVSCTAPEDSGARYASPRGALAGEARKRTRLNSSD